MQQQQQPAMKKQKRNTTTTESVVVVPQQLPELPPEVWCMIMAYLTNRGNPWLAGRLKVMCLGSDPCHHAGYQARLLMSKLRGGFPSTVYLGRRKQAQIFAFALGENMEDYASLQQVYYRPTPNKVDVAKALLKRTVETQLNELEFAMRRCGKAMGMKNPFSQDVLSYYGRIQSHVEYWRGYKRNHYPGSELFVHSGLTKACTPWLSVTFTLAEAEVTDIVEAAKWFSWTMASFASYHALELKLVVRRGLGDKASMVIKWDEWDRKSTHAFVRLVTKSQPPTWPDADASFQFEAAVYLRQDHSLPDFFGMTVHMNTTGGSYTEFFGDH